MNGLRKLRIPAAALVMVMTMALAAGAQITTGSVTGTIKDQQGGVVPGATVTLVNEAQATRSTPVVTNEVGDFVFPNVSAGTYTIEVSMPSFKSLKKSGVTVGAGTRTAVGMMTIEVGGASEVVDVKGEAPVIQATTGERSFTIPTETVANLPIANRSFTALTALTPGVSGTTRIGGGGGNNIMMDGVSAVDTGSNSILLQMNVESIAEVKVLTSNYQAEYGRSSGLQVSATTKSGTNRFHGSFYDVERNSDWNSNTKVNILNGDPKTVLRERDWGYSLGGPIGKPGKSNKLFFFYSHEYAPRQSGNDVQRFRMPTALERAGDFSRTLDNNGNPFPYIKDPNLTGTCSATNQAACFADGGVLGRIPKNRLYQTGLNILNIYPLPNLPDTPGVAYNYQITRPTEHALAWQPAVRIDYQPSNRIRGTFKYSGWQEKNQIFNGSIPGFNDTKMQNPVVSSTAWTVNYTISPTTFLEATYGHSQNELAGCGLAQGGTGPTFCTSAIPMNDVSNKNTAGLGGLPMLFPDALKLNTSYYAYAVLNGMSPTPPFWVNGQILRTPNFTWGNRIANAPPNIPFAGFLNINSTHDISVSVTKVAGRHTIKAGFYNTHSFKAQQQNSAATFGQFTFSNDTTNPLDAQFGYANAALGIVSSYNQQSVYIEGSYLYNNTEGYIQDNWKVNSRLTFDYGVRLVHQQPQYDSLGQASNFFPDQWSLSSAPVLYAAGCVNNSNPCSGTNRQALNPRTGQLLGPNTTFAIGTIVPGSGDPLNGLKVSGKGIVDTTYTYPNLGVAPRFGMAYDPSGRQRFVFRGGSGLFFDRPSGNDIYAQVTNPPAVQNVTVRYTPLQSLSGSSLQTAGAPALSVYQYDAKLPTSYQWNGGVQMALPWSSSLDIEYVGQHSWYSPQAVQINAIDFGTAFLRQAQDPTLAASATPGATALVTDLMRAYRGYGNIQRRMSNSWRTYHSIQVSFQRRFTRGLSFGFNDTIGLRDRQNSGARLQHDPATGAFSFRADQGQADALLQTDPTRHTMKGNFVWQLPGIKSDRPVLKSIGLVVNDWQLSGIWTASTGGTYTIGFNYQSGGSNVNLTGSPDYAGRVRIVGDTGAGCSGDTYRQFTTAAFQGPLVGSVGLESGNNYLHGCFSSVLDLAIARNIRLPGGRTIQLRADMFNAPNAAAITGRQTTMNLSGPGDPVTITNLPFDASGNLVASRSLPRGAGFGVASSYQNPRSVQMQIRFSF